MHSFTGTVEEMQRLVAMGFDIGVNGCSMKTEENLDVVRAIPLERIQIETDGPWVRIPDQILLVTCSPNITYRTTAQPTLLSILSPCISPPN